MDFKKIESELEKRHIPKKHFFEKTGIMTVQGFANTIKQGALKVTDLELISKELELPMSFWWEDTPMESKELNELKAENNLLKEKLEQSQKTTNTLTALLDDLLIKKGGHKVIKEEKPDAKKRSK